MYNRRVKVTSARCAMLAVTALLPAALAGCGATPDEARDEDVGATSSALTQVINVSNVAQLYSAFQTAAASSNQIEIRLAAGTYSLRSPSASDPDDTMSFSTGSLKVKRGTVTLVGGSDLSAAANFIIDGGWNNGVQIPLLYVAGSSSPQPQVIVKGVTFAHSDTVRRSPIQVLGGTLKMTNSVVFHTKTNGQGGGGLYANNKSNITLSRCLFSNNFLAAALGSSTTCGGLFDSGGAVLLANSSALIEYSTFFQGRACRGGGIFISGSPTNTVTINQSTITSNEARTRGGGLMILNSPTVRLNFNTISRNVAGTQAQVVAAEPQIAGGLSVLNAGTTAGSLKLDGNIIAQNEVVHPWLDDSPIPDGTDCYVNGRPPSISTQNGNIVGERGNCAFISAGPLVGTQAVPVNAQLYVPTNMGGGIFPGSITVQPPTIISPALWVYEPNGSNICPSVDQLGVFRTTPCTIGAVENPI